MNTTSYTKRIGTYDNGHSFKQYIKNDGNIKRETVIEDYKDKCKNKEVRIQFWNKVDYGCGIVKNISYHIDSKGLRKKVVSEYFNGG